MSKALGHGQARRAGLRANGTRSARARGRHERDGRTSGTSSSVTLDVEAPAFAVAVPLDLDAEPAASAFEVLEEEEEPGPGRCGSSARTTRLRTTPDGVVEVAGRFWGTVEVEAVGGAGADLGGECWLKRQLGSLQVLQSGHKPNRRCVGNI